MDYAKQKSLLHRIESEKFKTNTVKSINVSEGKSKINWAYWFTLILVSSAIIGLAAFSLMRMRGIV